MPDQIDPLTPRELRLIALMLGGLSSANIETRLGIEAAGVEDAAQAVKDEIRIGDLTIDAAVQDRLASAIQASADETKGITTEDERRIRLLLRLTLDDLKVVASDADLRASILEATVERLGSASAEEASREVEELRSTASAIRELAESLLEKFRSG